MVRRVYPVRFFKKKYGSATHVGKFITQTRINPVTKKKESRRFRVIVPERGRAFREILMGRRRYLEDVEMFS